MNVHAARLTTRVLAGVCGGLLLLAAAQYLGLGGGHRWSSGTHEAHDLNLGEVDRKPFQMPPTTEFAEVEQRPLFNTDRKPTPDEQAEEGEEADAAPPTNPLNVALTGIIISTDSEPPTRIALIRDNSRNQSLALKVGMPLEGPQGGWTLTDIHERSVVFTSINDESSEVELATSAAPRPGAQGGRQRAASPAANAKQDEKSDLAERIEKRRAEMRERAEKLREQRANERKSQKK